MRAVFLEEIDSKSKDIVITGDDAFHLIKVVRLKTSENILLLNGKGLMLYGRVENITKKQVIVSVDRFEFVEKKSHFTLLCGKPKKNTCEEIIRLSAELGLSHVYFWNSEFAQQGDVSADRIKSILKNAMEQSNLPWCPKIFFINNLKESTELMQNFSTLPLYIFHNGESSSSPSKNNLENCIFSIGPEGGFSKIDLELLQSLSLKHYFISIDTPIMTTPTAVACAAGFLHGFKF
jgi:16S rRNA (uracil1498-N3)-methyltransferase